MKKLYSISEVAQKYNVSMRTLKFYEELGLLQSLRNDLNRRVYDGAAMAVLDQILIMKKSGIRLKKIKEIFETKSRTEIIEIIAEQKSFISREAGRLLEMKDEIDSFKSQIMNDDLSAAEILARCKPVHSCNIKLSDMEMVQSLEGITLSKSRAESGVTINGNLPCIKLVRNQNGEQELSISGECTRAASELEYTMPISVFVTAKTTGGNLWFFFGKYRMAFNRKNCPSELFIYDGFLNCEFHIPLSTPIERDEYVTIQWVFKRERNVVYLNGKRIFFLDYANYCDYSMKSTIGIGTDCEDTVTVKNISFTEIDSWDMQEIELSSMKLSKSKHYMKGRELEIFTVLDREAAGTREAFTVPLKIDLEAKTNDCNIRLSYCKGGFILNWEKDRQSLIYRDIYTGNQLVLESGGFLTPGEYHIITWIIQTGFTALIVDGICRFYTKSSNRTQDDNPDIVRITTAFGSTLTVRKLVISELE